MVKSLLVLTLTMVCVVSFGGAELRGQSQPQPQAQPQPQPQSEPQARGQETQPARAAVKPAVPLQVQVVVSRFQGDKKIGSVPYTLSVNAGHFPSPGRPAQLRIGAEVPVSGSYRPLGTNIDCRASVLEDGRFQVDITIDDSSVYVDGQAAQGLPKPGEPPIIRAFRLSNEFTLRDGQSTQFTAATDRIIGEVIRVDVTVNAVK